MPSTIFDKAIEHIINGDTTGLIEIINKYPDIVHQRSSSEHGAQLIHYLGANGIEDHLQKSPKNAPEIAKLLLSHDANPNSPAHLYGVESYVLDLLCSSIHPYLAGVQSSLIKVLVKGGAKINGINDDGSPLGLALGFGYTKAAETLYHLGARVDNILFAAGLGLIELIKSENGNPAFLKYKCNSGERVGAFTWPPPCLDDPRTNALIYAAFHNRIEVVNYFLEEGINPNSGTKMNQTAMHFAAYSGHKEIVKLLIKHGANPAHKEPQWNSVPAGWAKNMGHIKLANYLKNLS